MAIQKTKPTGDIPLTYIIAEMACSHEGDPALARKIIDGAGQAGADSIQSQTRPVASGHDSLSPLRV